MTHPLLGPDWTEHRLTSGSLHLKSAAGQSSGLFRLAERLNTRRAFLFVSTVLGRHIPVDPKTHRSTLRELADKVSDRLLDGPVFVMGYAETAVGLGAGVFQELRGKHPGRAIGYQATTRFVPCSQQVWFRIEEPHSHASDHAILKPKKDVLKDGPGATLVLVDDETTTGTTFRNLAVTLHENGAHFDRIVLATLTDWSEGAAADGVAGALPDIDVAAVALFEGAWRWKQDRSKDALRLPGAIAAECPAWHPSGDALLEVPRHGLSGASADTVTPRLAERITTEAGLDTLPDGARVLVLGSGEQVWDPFLFAEHAAKRHPNTRFVCTTRSPILLGDTIRSKITFGDHYGLGLAMYLHNVDPAMWDAIVLFNETGLPGVPQRLIDALGHVVVVDQNARVMRLCASEGAA